MIKFNFVVFILNQLNMMHLILSLYLKLLIKLKTGFNFLAILLIKYYKSYLDYSAKKYLDFISKKLW